MRITERCCCGATLDLDVSLWAAGAAVTVYVMGRYIVGPGRWTS